MTEPFICNTCGELSSKHYTLRGTIRKAIGHEPVEQRSYGSPRGKGRPTPKRPPRRRSVPSYSRRKATKKGANHEHGTGRFLPASVHYEIVWDEKQGTYVRRTAPVQSMLDKRYA